LSLKGGLVSAKVEVKYEAEDLERFSQEHAVFRDEFRLMPSSLPKAPSEDEMDWLSVIKTSISLTRLGDLNFSEPFIHLVYDRILQGPLMESFGIPAIEDKEIAKPMDSKAVPGEGTYLKVRMQVYWLALHVWLLHSKQHLLQRSNGLFDSAACALLTRRIFEWQWDRIRMLLYAADVPVMSISNELQDLQEFVFGLCQALDDVFAEEALEGDTAAALALDSADFPSGCHGLAPRTKYALWANVYSGSVPHESPELYELTVYLLRQRIALEATARGSFFMCRFDWSDMPQRPEQPTPLSDV
jgi:hypothetical protein